MMKYIEIDWSDEEKKELYHVEWEEPLNRETWTDRLVRVASLVRGLILPRKS